MVAANSKNISRFFNTIAGEYTTQRYGNRQDVLTYEMQARRRVVMAMLDAYGCKNGKLLDAGCGSAPLVRDYLARSYDVWGIDCSERMIEEARSSVCELADHFEVGDIERMVFPSESFDIVVSLGVLHYLKDDEQALCEMWRVLKPGGVVILSISNALSPSQILRKMFASMRALLGRGKDHSAFFSGVGERTRSPGSIDKQLKRIGFKKVASRFTGSVLIPCNIKLPSFYPYIHRLVDAGSRTLFGSEYIVMIQKVADIESRARDL